MTVHYLEIVSHDVDAVCSAYAKVHSVQFSEPDALLGGARTAALPDGVTVGVRAPLRDTETPVVRPYGLVENIEQAVADAVSAGAVVALPPMSIPGKGTIAITLLGGNEHGLWQL
ncbi:MAG: hydroxylase [Pseudomonadota bacterium]